MVSVDPAGFQARQPALQNRRIAHPAARIAAPMNGHGRRLSPLQWRCKLTQAPCSKPAEVRRVMRLDAVFVVHGAPFRPVVTSQPLTPVARQSGLVDGPRARRRRLLRQCSVSQHVVASVGQTVHAAGSRGMVQRMPGGAAAGRKPAHAWWVPRSGEADPAQQQVRRPCPDAGFRDWMEPSLRGLDRVAYNLHPCRAGSRSSRYPHPPFRLETLETAHEVDHAFLYRNAFWL